MIVHPCIPCQYGDHDHHMDTPEPAVKGVMGGWSCACRGECRGRDAYSPPPSHREARASDPG